MRNITRKSESSQPVAETAVYLFDDWFDPIEAGVRDRVREFIQAWRELRRDAVGGTALEHRPRIIEKAIENGAISFEKRFRSRFLLHRSAHDDVTGEDGDVPAASLSVCTRHINARALGDQ